MVEFITNPLLILFAIGSFSAYSLVGIDPSEQRDRASFTTAKSNVSTMCRAQALCRVEHNKDKCLSFGPNEVDMIDPSDETWTYTFGDQLTEGGRVMGKGNLSGTNFTLTCTNERNDPNFAKVICSDDGAGRQSCAKLDPSSLE